ncbi:MAG: malonyl-CoA synthase [Rhizobiaceae bacterium]
MTNHLYHGLLARSNPTDVFAKIPAEENGQPRIINYHDVVRISARYANVLIERGLKPGDRVASQAPKSIDALMLYLATVRAGGVFLPLNTAYTPNEIEYFLGDAEPILFICAPENYDDLRPIAKKLGIGLETLSGTNSGTLYDAASNAAGEFKDISRASDDLAAILYTSGTTGRSKGAMLSHDNLLSNAVALVDLWQFNSKDVLLHALPIFHTHGLFVATNVALLCGASMIFLPAFNNDSVIENLPNCTTMMGVPTFYTRLLGDERFTKELVAHIRLFVSGSAPLLAETHIAFEERTGHRVLERYGMTETNMITSNPYAEERCAGTVGFPLVGIKVRISDADTGMPLEAEAVGVIEVKGPNVFSGYWKMPEKTADEFREDGFFITGDLGKIDERGYLHIVGRAKDLIISGGYNIYPKEIELLLDEQEGVLESAVVGVPHPDFGEGVVGVIVPSGKGFDPVETLAKIKPLIARFKQPKILHVVDELPRNTMGKVQKNTLRKLLQNTFTE